MHEEFSIFLYDVTCQYAIVDAAMAKVIAAEVNHMLPRDVMQMENGSFQMVYCVSDAIYEVFTVYC